jgi:hypothetical protein
MPITGIYLDHLTISAKKGIECLEAKDVHFADVQLFTKETDPLVTVRGSQDITLDNIRYDKADMFMMVQGENCRNILVTGTDVRKSKESTRFSAGATNKALQVR